MWANCLDTARRALLSARKHEALHGALPPSCLERTHTRLLHVLRHGNMQQADLLARRSVLDGPLSCWSTMPESPICILQARITPQPKSNATVGSPTKSAGRKTQYNHLGAKPCCSPATSRGCVRCQTYKAQPQSGVRRGTRLHRCWSGSAKPGGPTSAKPQLGRSRGCVKARPLTATWNSKATTAADEPASAASACSARSVCSGGGAKMPR